MSSILDSMTIVRAYELVTGASTAGAKRIGRHLSVQCPDRAHEDQHASCDLDTEKNVWTCRSCPGATTDGGMLDLAIAAGHARDHAEAAAWFEERLGPSRRMVFDYVSVSGQPVGRVKRIEPGRDGRSKDFVQYRFEGGQFVAGLKGAKLPLYHIDALVAAAQSGGTAFVTEGEGKADTLGDALERSGSKAVVTTIAGGHVAKLQPEHIAAFRGFAKVVVLADSDTVGRASADLRARTIASAHPDLDVRVVDLYPDRDDGSDVADWLGAGHDLHELKTLLAAAPRIDTAAAPVVGEKPPTSVATVGGVLTFDDLARRASEHVDWFIEGLVRRSGILLMASQPKVGKSDTARNLAKAIATGGEFLGRRCQRGRVLWIGLEEPESHLKERVEIMRMQQLDIVYVVERPVGDEAAWLRSTVETHKPDVVIIDTIGRFANIENVNDYSQVKRATQPTLDLRSQYGTTFVLLHHNNHANKTLGSTMWEGFCDTIMSLSRNLDGTRFIQTKQRSGIDLEPTVLSMDHDTGSITCGVPAFIADQRIAEQRILEHLRTIESATREDLATVSGRRVAAGRAAVDTLVAGGLIRCQGTGAKGSPRLYSAIGTKNPSKSLDGYRGTIYVEDSEDSEDSGRGTGRSKSRNSEDSGDSGDSEDSDAPEMVVPDDGTNLDEAYKWPELDEVTPGPKATLAGDDVWTQHGRMCSVCHRIATVREVDQRCADCISAEVAS